MAISHHTLIVPADCVSWFKLNEPTRPAVRLHAPEPSLFELGQQAGQQWAAEQAAFDHLDAAEAEEFRAGFWAGVAEADAEFSEPINSPVLSTA